MLCEKKLSIILIGPAVICILIFTFFYTNNSKNIKNKLRTSQVTQKCFNKLNKIKKGENHEFQKRN